MCFSVHKSYNFKTVSFWPIGNRFIFPLETTKTLDKIHEIMVFNTKHKMTKDYNPGEIGSKGR